MANEVNGIYEPGQDVSGRCSVAVTGKRFVKISGNRASGNVAIAPADAAAKAFGVAGRDAAVGEVVRVLRGNSRVVEVRAGGDIAAFADVEIGAAGVAVTKTSGVAVGYAVTAATNGGDAEISLY
ncbi:capsid cement protein [Gordonia phosphorivorans]|uniref:Capsid cement protein n=1 Tax=Gordonia phosphorivorans TaxID=1056982 RepID=A0ABV6H6I5_9ACTN